jgi:hypothetical protein
MFPVSLDGGEAQRNILKARAAKIPCYVSEVFAFSTSRTVQMKI